LAVLFGTLGWRPQSLIPTIRSTEDVEKLIFYHSDHPDSLSARDAVMEYCETIGLPVRPVELADAFDLVECAKRIRKDVRAVREEGKKIAKFNIAGGTRLMSSAALLVCILEGIPASYVHDETLEEIQLPLLQIRYSEALSSKQMEILRFLLANRESSFSESELALAMGLHRATMNYHVKELLRKGVIEVVPDKEDNRVKIIKVGPAVELLLD